MPAGKNVFYNPATTKNKRHIIYMAEDGSSISTYFVSKHSRVFKAMLIGISQ